MKRILIVCLLLVAFGTLGYSQQKPFLFGFKVGPNIGWIRPDAEDYERESVEPGFAWGFLADFFLMENYYIGTGFNIVYLNGNLKYPHGMKMGGDTLTPGTLQRKYKLKYVEIPVVFKMKTRDFGKFRFYGQIGLGTSFLIGAKADDKFTADNGAVVEEENDIENEITFVRESLILGVGAQYSLGGSSAIFAGFTFDNGFTDILKRENVLDPTIYQKGFANYFEFNVGMLF